MFGRWSFAGGALEEIWLVASFGGEPPPAEAERLEPVMARHRLRTWSFQRSLARSTLVEIVKHLEPHLIGAASAEMSWLRDRVDDALRSGRLTAYALYQAVTPSGGSAKGEEKPAASAPPPPPKETTTWIAIQLRNKKGDAVAFKRYRIELPDGSTREGMLDAKGAARVEGIVEPGTCQVSFPDFDAAEWRPA